MLIQEVAYLGLDQMGLARSDKAMYRLVEKGALHPTKIAGHLAFNQAELDIVAANGDQKRGRGRPKKCHSAQILHKRKCY